MLDALVVDGSDDDDGQVEATQRWDDDNSEAAIIYHFH